MVQKQSRASTNNIEKELAQIIRSSLPNVLKDEAEHTAEIIMISLQRKGIFDASKDLLNVDD